MPSLITHAVTGLAAGKLATSKPLPRRFWALSIGCTLLPDLDGIGLFLGIPYGHFLGHRGFMHSPFFALLVGLAIPAIYRTESQALTKKRWLATTYFTLLTASHGILDGLTNGGLGIAFYSPLSNERYFLPWRPLEVSPLGIIPFFTKWGYWVLRSEVIWIWFPLAVALAGVISVRYLLAIRAKSPVGSP